MEVMATLSPKWIIMVFLRDFVLFLTVTGGLHWWFYIYEGQEKKFKYDTKLNKKNSKVFFRSSK